MILHFYRHENTRDRYAYLIYFMAFQEKWEDMAMTFKFNIIPSRIAVAGVMLSALWLPCGAAELKPGCVNVEAA